MTRNGRLFDDLNAETMRESDSAYGLVAGAAISVMDKIIKRVGPVRDLPAPLRHSSRASLGGRLVTLGPADCPVAQSWRANGAGDGSQPRHIAIERSAAEPEHGLHPVPVEPRRGAARREPNRRSGPWRDDRHHRPGLCADLAVWDVKPPAELACRIGINPLHTRIFGGKS